MIMLGACYTYFHRIIVELHEQYHRQATYVTTSAFTGYTIIIGEDHNRDWLVNTSVRWPPEWTPAEIAARATAATVATRLQHMLDIWTNGDAHEIRRMVQAFVNDERTAQMLDTLIIKHQQDYRDRAAHTVLSMVCTTAT